MPDPSLTPTASVEYVDASALEERTPISRQTWRRMRATGGGPPWRRVGRRVIYRWADVVAWIDAQPSGEAG